MTNTETASYLANLPTSVFSPAEDDGFEFNLPVTTDEFTGVVLPVLTEWIRNDVSVQFTFTSSAYRGTSFGHLSVRATDDELQAAEVAQALFRVFESINSAG